MTSPPPALLSRADMAQTDDPERIWMSITRLKTGRFGGSIPSLPTTNVVPLTVAVNERSTIDSRAERSSDHSSAPRCLAPEAAASMPGSAPAAPGRAVTCSRRGHREARWVSVSVTKLGCDGRAGGLGADEYQLLGRRSIRTVVPCTSRTLSKWVKLFTVRSRTCSSVAASHGRNPARPPGCWARKSLSRRNSLGKMTPPAQGRSG
jgi:hypothetical protein